MISDVHLAPMISDAAATASRRTSVASETCRPTDVMVPLYKGKALLRRDCFGVGIAALGALGGRLDASDFLARPHDAERVNGARPVAEQERRPLRAGQLRVALEQVAQALRRGCVELGGLDELRVQPHREALVGVVHEELAAGHAGCDVAAEGAYDDHRAARHVLAEVAAGALDDRRRT